LLGETLLEKGCPPSPLPKPFIAFSAQGVCDTLSRKSSRVQKKSLRNNSFQKKSYGKYKDISIILPSRELLVEYLLKDFIKNA